MELPHETNLLHELADLYGIQRFYYDLNYRKQTASEEALVAVLQSLGAPVVSLQDVTSAWRERRQSTWQQILEPVIVAWGDSSVRTKLRLPIAVADTLLTVNLTLETGERKTWTWHGADLPATESAEIEGVDYVARELSLPEALPYGYHRLYLEVAGKTVKAIIIAAPTKAYLPPETEERIWGAFLPLYALRTGKDWGAGSYCDLASLTDWIAGLGGKVMATLPFLASFTGGTIEPSPYTPASRLMWNELYLDTDKIPELEGCQSARALMSSSAFQAEIMSLRDSPLVDYDRHMALKRRILEELSQYFLTHPSKRLDTFRQSVKSNPTVEDYARFQATTQKQRSSWWHWPESLRNGGLKESDYDEAVKDYHLYVQWLAREQVEVLSRNAHQKGVYLYLDLPLGVHPDGYDIWHERDAFALDASAGAPPDNFFASGQNWGFQPLHPEKIREQEYRYPIAYLRHHLSHAGVLRIDHIMHFHRLYWIPRGIETSKGTYVNYRAEELYAILSLESHRSKCLIVGEDLGTVPEEVRGAMTEHGFQRMYVLHFELKGDAMSVLNPVSPEFVASLNTHDLPTSASFFRGLDIEKRLAMNLLTEEEAQQETKARQKIRDALAHFLQNQGWLKGATGTDDTQAIINACLAYLGASQARIVLVNLEDLWGETEPQNMPGTWRERPNWRRKARFTLEEFRQMPQAIDILKELDALRKTANKANSSRTTR